MQDSTKLRLLPLLVLLGCVALPYVPTNSELLREDGSLRLYKTPNGYMVVSTRQMVDAGNEICEFDDREEAIAYFENEAAGRPDFVECLRYGWGVPKSQGK